MTEADWLASTDLQRMLDFVHNRTSDRKMRLFACACCRSIWSMLQDERTRKAVEVAERFADGLASDRERADAAARAEDKACENEADDLDMPSWAAYWSAAPTPTRRPRWRPSIRPPREPTCLKSTSK